MPLIVPDEVSLGGIEDGFSWPAQNCRIVWAAELTIEDLSFREIDLRWSSREAPGNRRAPVLSIRLSSGSARELGLPRHVLAERTNSVAAGCPNAINNAVLNSRLNAVGANDSGQLTVDEYSLTVDVLWTWHSFPLSFAGVDEQFSGLSARVAVSDLDLGLDLSVLTDKRRRMFERTVIGPIQGDVQDTISSLATQALDAAVDHRFDAAFTRLGGIIPENWRMCHVEVDSLQQQVVMWLRPVWYSFGCLPLTIPNTTGKWPPTQPEPTGPRIPDTLPGLDKTPKGN